jgi:hypothetical protein
MRRTLVPLNSRFQLAKVYLSREISTALPWEAERVLSNAKTLQYKQEVDFRDLLHMNRVV